MREHSLIGPCPILVLVLSILLFSPFLGAQSPDRIRVYLVVDISGSMDRETDEVGTRRIDVAAKELLERAQLAFDSKRADVQLVLFDDLPRRMEILSMEDAKHWANWMVRDSRLDGLTNLWDALYDVAEDIEGQIDSYRYFHVATITDGIHSPRHGSSGKYRVLHDEEDVRTKFRNLGESLTEKQGIGIKIFQWGRGHLGRVADLVNEQSGVPESAYDPPTALPAIPKPAVIEVELQGNGALRFVEQSDASIPRVAVLFTAHSANVKAGSRLTFEVRGVAAARVKVVSPSPVLPANGSLSVELQLSEREWLINQSKDLPLEIASVFAEPGMAPRDVGTWSLAASFTPGAAFEVRGPEEMKAALKIGESSECRLEVVPNEAARGRLVKLWFSSRELLEAFGELPGWEPLDDSSTELCRTFDEELAKPIELSLRHDHQDSDELRGRIVLSGIGYPSSHALNLAIATRVGTADVLVSPDAASAIDLSPGTNGVRIPKFIMVTPLDHAQDESVVLDWPSIEGARIDLTRNGEPITRGEALMIGRSIELDLFMAWDNLVVTHEQIEAVTSEARIQVQPVHDARLRLQGDTIASLPTITSRPHVSLKAIGRTQLTGELGAPLKFPFHVTWNQAAWESLSSEVALQVEITDGAGDRTEVIELDPIQPIVFGSSPFDAANQETTGATWIVSVILNEIGATWSGTVTAEMSLGANSIYKSEPVAISAHVPEAVVKANLTPSGSEIVPNDWGSIGTLRLEPTNGSALGAKLSLESSVGGSAKSRFRDLQTGKLLDNGKVSLRKVVGAATEVGVEVLVDAESAAGDLAGNLALQIPLPPHTRLEGLDSAENLIEYTVAIPVLVFVANGKDLLPGTVMRTVSNKEPELSASIREGVLSSRISCPAGSKSAVLQKKLELTVSNSNERWKNWVKDYYWVASGEREATIEQLTENSAVEVVFKESAPNNFSSRQVNLQVIPRALEGAVPVEVYPRAFIVSSELPSRWSLAQLLTWILPLVLLGLGLIVWAKLRAEFTGKIFIRPALGRVEQVLDVPVKRAFGLGVTTSAGFPEMQIDDDKGKMLAQIEPKSGHVLLVRKSPTAEIFIDGVPMTLKRISLAQGTSFTINGAEARYVDHETEPREVEPRVARDLTEANQPDSNSFLDDGAPEKRAVGDDFTEDVDPLDAWGDDDAIEDEKGAW